MINLNYWGTIHLSSRSAKVGDDLTGYQIDDVPSIEIDEQFKQILEQSNADSAQVDLMSEAIIAVDESDNEIGPISKVEAH